MRWRGTSGDSSHDDAGPFSLHDRLTEIKAGIAQYVRAENRRVNDDTITRLQAQGIAQNALPPGTPAPRFELANHDSKNISLTQLLSKGVLVVKFFRGRWCPFCVAELEAWRDAYPALQAAGGELVAISPQLPRHNAFMASQHRLPFPLLFDEGNRVAEEFNVAYEVPADQQSLYRSSFVNLENLNGDHGAHWKLPLAGTFVIDSAGIIRHSLVSNDYTERSEPAEAIGMVAALKAASLPAK